MARYLKSLVTGVVLPYNTAALKSADVRQMSASECAEYEASIGKTSAPAPDAVEVTTTPVVEEPVVEEPVVEEPVVTEPEVGEHIVEDFDPDVAGVLGALEVE